MTVLLAAGLVVFAAATAVIVRANLRIYRERRRWQAERETADAIAARLAHVNGSINLTGAGADAIYSDDR